MTTSIIDQIKDLETRRQELLETARDDAMRQATDAIETLKQLGFNYRIVAKNGKRTVRAYTRKHQQQEEEQTPAKTNAPYPTDADLGDVT